MAYGLMGRVHAEAAWLWRRLTTPAAGDRGQGTVEYVALILLVAVVLAGVVAATKKTNLGSGDIGKAIMDKIKGAIDDVSN
jgi:nitrate reductase gamma subunit